MENKKVKNRINAFTLVETIVWISISILLMVSIWVLVSGGIWNLTKQEKDIKNNKDFSSFQKKITDIFFRVNKNFKPVIVWDWTNTGVYLKIDSNYDEIGFVYIWSTWSIKDNSWNGIYCLSWSEDVTTNHIFIKSFIPDFDLDTQKSHEINGIWRWFFWYNEIENEWLNKDEVYLNNPTWTWSNWIIKFISDTWNNRVLYESGSKIYKLLDWEDWLLEPTWLYYSDSENALYISNSAKWEILKFYSEKIQAPILTLTWVSFSGKDKFEIEFFDQNWEKNIDNNLNTSDFTFDNYTRQGWDSLSTSNNKLIYSFSWWTIISFNDEEIKIDNLSGFSWTWTYYAKLQDKIYPFFSQSDDDILTLDDNKLEIHNNWLKYPTKINWTSNSDFEQFDPTSNLDYDKKYDYILKVPIKDLSLKYDNSKELLSFEMKYYSRYNCYDEEGRMERTFILKKNFKK